MLARRLAVLLVLVSLFLFKSLLCRMIESDGVTAKELLFGGAGVDANRLLYHRDCWTYCDHDSIAIVRLRSFAKYSGMDCDLISPLLEILLMSLFVSEQIVLRYGLRTALLLALGLELLSP